MYRTVPRPPTLHKIPTPPGVIGAGCAMIPLALYFALFDVPRAGATEWCPTMVLCSLVPGFVGYATARKT